VRWIERAPQFAKVFASFFKKKRFLAWTNRAATPT